MLEPIKNGQATRIVTTSCQWVVQDLRSAANPRRMLGWSIWIHALGLERDTSATDRP